MQGQGISSLADIGSVVDFFLIISQRDLTAAINLAYTIRCKMLKYVGRLRSLAQNFPSAAVPCHRKN